MTIVAGQRRAALDGGGVTRRRFLAGLGGLAIAGSPLYAAGSQTPEATEQPSLLATMLAMVPEEAVTSPYGGAAVDFFLPGVTLDALRPRLDLDLAFAPNPMSLAFNTMPDTGQLREMFAATPMAVAGFLTVGDLVLIRGEFDREPLHAAWTALGYAPGDDPDIFEFQPSDPERASDELWELHDRLRLPGRYGMWTHLCLVNADTVVAADDPALIDTMRSDRGLADGEVGAAALRSLAGADIAALSMGRIRFGDQLPTRSRRPTRAGERSQRIDRRTDEAIAETAAELGPLPAIASMLAGSTPGAPWVDDLAGPANPAAAWVALVEPQIPGDAARVVDIVTRRFETTFSVRHEMPFTELLSLDLAEVGEASGLARFEFSPIGTRRFDLEYFLYHEDAPFLYADPA